MKEEREKMIEMVGVWDEEFGEELKNKIKRWRKEGSR